LQNGVVDAFEDFFIKGAAEAGNKDANGVGLSLAKALGW
jgi:hypothetical protein